MNRHLTIRSSDLSAILRCLPNRRERPIAAIPNRPDAAVQLPHCCLSCTAQHLNQGTDRCADLTAVRRGAETGLERPTPGFCDGELCCGATSRTGLMLRAAVRRTHIANADSSVGPDLKPASLSEPYKAANGPRGLRLSFGGPLSPHYRWKFTTRWDTAAPC